MPLSNTGKLVFAKASGFGAACVAMPVAIFCVDRLAEEPARRLGHCIGRELLVGQSSALLPLYDAYKKKSLPPAEYAEWRSGSDEEKATGLACELMHDGVNLLAALGAGYAGTTAAKRALGAKVPTGKVLSGQLLDSGVTLGSLLVLNLGLGHQMHRASAALSAGLQRTGMKKDAADCAANSLTSFSLPDAIGTGVGLAYLLHGSAR